MDRSLREETSDKTVLCVDDTPLILQLYRRIFEERGYEVLLASSGWDGLEALKHQAVDCLILDLQMPGIDGAAVIEQMSHDENSPPVVLVSGSDPPWELLAQVDAFVQKPFLVAEVVDRVEDVLGLRVLKGPERPSRAATSAEEGNAYSAD